MAILDKSSTNSNYDVSIVICAYNSETRLPDVLEALKGLIVPEQIKWEVVVVDNNSSDKTTEVAHTYKDRTLGNGVKLKVVFEPMQGLIYARRRGWQEAKGTIISFLDDDNIPESNYIEALWGFFCEHPNAGLVGPKVLPLIDYEPPSYFKYIQVTLALRDLGDEPIDTTHTNLGHPPGAGMSCRHDVLKNILGQDEFALTGRAGDQLLSGEDSMIAISVKNKGLDWWYEPKMVIYHKLPQSRMEMPYLLRLFRGMGLSSVQIGETMRERPMTVIEHLNEISRYTIRNIVYGCIEYLHPEMARRQYARLLRAMFQAGIEVHIRNILQSSKCIT